MESEKKAPRASNLRNILIVGAVALAGYYFVLGGKDRWPFGSPAPEAAEPAAAAAESGPPTLELSEKQLIAIKVGKIAPHEFRIVKAAVGNVDFNQDKSVQVSTPYQGRILEIPVALGDRVKRGQILFTLESPDLMAAEATLIQNAGLATLFENNLTRLRGATKLGGTAQKDLDQAVSDQQTAEGNLRSAKLAVSVFGKTDEEIERIATSRKVDPSLIIRSPVDGIVSARVAGPGLLVQPGNSPITISDDSSMWLNSFVIESDAVAMGVGQAVAARIPAASSEVFTGHVTRVGSLLDPNTHRLLVRTVIDDPERKLRAGMIGSYEITVAEAETSPSIPTTGVVREGDGTMTAWVQKDASHFTQQVVKLGIQQDGFDQILDGLKEGDPVIVDGAIFVDNILNAGPSD